MAKATNFLCNFTSGVLDPRLNGRADLSHYENGLSEGTNVIVMPYGGVKRRGGLRFIDEIPRAVANGFGRLANFSFNSTDQQYLIVFVDFRIYFYRNDALITNINGTGFPYLVSPYPIATAAQIKWVQSADTMVIVHEDYQPRTLVRGAADNLWTIATVTFTNTPQIDFNDGSSPAPTSEIQDITFTGFANGNLFKLDLENVTTDVITYDATSTTATANRIREALQDLYNVGSGDITVAFTAGTTYRVTFQNGAARNYDLMTGYPTTGAGNTVAVAPITNGVPRTEDAWSATRGWPRTVCFYENRLVFGGSKQLPTTVFLSVSNDYFNFDLGEGLDDEAIMKDLNTDQLNSIVNVVPGRHLQIYTQGAEFYVPDFPITPENSNFRPQTTHGSAGLRTASVEGTSLFMDGDNRGLYQFVYNDVEAAYTANSLSRISSHLIKTPVDMAIQRPSSDEDTNYVYLVNSDGTVAVLNTLRSEEIAAWTPWVTDGLFVSVACLTESVYFMVQRTDGTGTAQWYIEKLDSSYYTDSSEHRTGASATVWAVGTRLNGLSCRIKGNSAVQANATPAAGSVTIATASTSIEIGRNFDVSITPMPVAIAGQMGISMMRRTRVDKLMVLLYQTCGLKFKGESLPDRYMNVDPLNTAASLLTGTHEFAVSGWDRLQTLPITQTDPLPLTLLALEYEVEIN